MDNKEYLDKLLIGNTTQEAAFAFFDRLDPVDSNDMWGLWEGEEIRSGHPMEGLLTVSGWYGKKFINEEEVHPLVFQKENGELFSANPGLLPLHIPYGKYPDKAISLLMKTLRPLLSTEKSRARLRQVEYRGKVSASMIYDQKDIIDVFRKVDDQTIVGVMDIKHQFPGKSYFFVLRKVDEG